MSMGYDEDDPRREMIRENFALGIYCVKDGKKPARRSIPKGPRSVTIPARQK